MSFYGNISNISRTQFRFERTYANRKIMDESAAMDGVYVGNYVLVDYDTELAADWGVPCYAYPHVNGNYYQSYAKGQITAENFNTKVNNGQCFVLDAEENKFIVPELDTFDTEKTYYQYMDIDPEPNGAVELWTAERGTLGAHRITYAESIVSHITYPTASATKTYFKYFLVKGNQLTTDLNGVNTLTVFNHLNGDDGNLKDTLFEVYSFVQTSNNQNEWYPIVRAISEDNHVYARNFTIDSLYYDNARGYDSTVWQKTYSGNPATARYVMIAELNSVVPSFSVSGDAPTLSPTVPHFSTESTNFHYKLHMQAPWGMRVKSAVNVYGQEYTTGSAGERVRLNFEPIIKKALPSDENVVWTRPFYNEDLGTIDTYTFTWNETSADKLTIAGIWDTTVSTNSSVPGAIYYNKAGFNPNISVHNYLVSDHITVEPSGLSGQKYNTHGAIYTALNPITSEVAFGLAVAQREKYCQDNYKQQQIMVSGSNPEKFYDLYGRDKLYKIQNNKYVVAEYYDNNVEQYYYKSTNVAPNSSAPDVDTQEIAIMLPSIGNSIADMWDLIYGDSVLNGDNYRNTQLDWINGSTYYRGSGLRLLSFVDEGIEYNVEAVNTLAGSINTAHDLLGMLIRKRPNGVTAIGENNLLNNDNEWDNDKINNLKTLSNAYVYYYPDEYKYYRLGTTYEWDMTGKPVTTYDAANKNSERYLVEVNTNENNRIAVWPEPNTGLFYIEECEGWEKGAGVKQYNYVLEQKYTKGIKYYTIDTTDCTLVETVMNAFHPEDYYEHDDEFSLTYIENEVEKTKTISAFVKTKDEVANPSTHYFKLGDKANNVPAYQLLGNEYRFFECDENDTERQYYVLASEYYVDDGTHPDDPNWELAQETHLNDLNQEIIENISENTYNVRPSKYFIRNAENKYVNTEAYLSNTEYYTPVRFNLVASLQEFLQYQAEGRRFYSVDAKRSADRKIWLQTTTYVRQDDINNTNFSRYVLYTKTENGYIVALTYDENETYYTKNVSFILTQEVPTISADNATEFKLLNPNETNDYGYSKYYYYNPVGTSGYPEYYAVTPEIANRMELPIVTVNATENTGFFVPGVYYYKVETGEYAGSWLLEISKLPKQGRQYYMNGFGIKANEAPEKSDKITLQNFSYYSSDEFYDAPDDLNQNTIFISDDGKYYKYSPLFVYNDPTGTFKQGEKWNMNVSLTPRDADENNCIQLRQYKEIPQMIELHNFGRNTHTLVGGLRRLDEYLSINDTKTRSRKTVQGVLNNLLDIVDVFKDISPNELLISNQYGQIYSRGIVLNNVNDNNIIAHSATDAADPWVHLTENRVDDQGNWHIQVHHKLLNNDDGTLQPVTHTDLVINAAEDAQAQTPLFGETFNILNRVKKDDAGHLHSIVTDTVTIPLPSLTEKMGLDPLSTNILAEDSTWNDWNVMMGIELNPTTAAFTYRRHNVADLKLHDYSNTDSSTNPDDNTATKLTLSSDNSINTAFAAIESYIWNSDVQDVFAPTANNTANKLDSGVTTANIANWYITNLTETDGRINYSLTRLINTSSDIVLRSDDAVKGQTAVSAHAVREAINDLDIADKCAPNAALAANKLDNNTNNGNIANWYITGLSETDGLIDYSFTRLINTSSDIVLRSSDNIKGQTAVSAHAVREAINDLDSQYSITVADGEYVTGIQITNGLIDTTTIGTVTGKNTFESSITRTSTSKVAPQTAAVATYLDSVLNAMATINSTNTSYYITSLSQDTNGKIAYELTSLLTTVAGGYGTSNGYAASGKMVRASIDDIFATTQTISAGDFISSWSYTANAEGYKRFAVGTTSFITNISTNTDSVIAPTTGAVVTYVTNTINELDASASVTNTSTAAKFITGITQTNGTITSISDTPFIDTIVGNETGDNSIIAPTTAAVVSYLDNQFSAYTGTTNVTTLGTISEGTWEGTAITDDYLDINSLGADKIIISQEDLTNMIADLETTPTPESTDITDDDDSTLLAILRKMYHRIKTLEDNA